MTRLRCHWQEIRSDRENKMKKKSVLKDLIILWIALAALVCAALNLHISLNMLREKED